MRPWEYHMDESYIEDTDEARCEVCGEVLDDCGDFRLCTGCRIALERKFGEFLAELDEEEINFLDGDSLHDVLKTLHDREMKAERFFAIIK